MSPRLFIALSSLVFAACMGDASSSNSDPDGSGVDSPGLEDGQAPDATGGEIASPAPDAGDVESTKDAPTDPGQPEGDGAASDANAGVEGDGCVACVKDAVSDVATDGSTPTEDAAGVADAGCDPFAPCGTPPNCECVSATCVETELPPGTVCAAFGTNPDCLALVLESFAADGCGEPCLGMTVPGLESICNAPACQAMIDLLPIIMGANPCDTGCVCIPDCDGKSCGDNGCGGSCGDCAAPLACVEGVCAYPCDGAATCECAASDCLGVALEDAGISIDLACAVLDDSPECLTVILDAYASEGCGQGCNGFTLPGLEEVCAHTACKAAMALVKGYGIDACSCYP